VSPIRVLLADDHPVLRAGLRRVLEDAGDIEVVGEAADGASALRQNAVLAPDVLLLDLAMAGVGGVEVARRVQAGGATTRILVLSALDDEVYLEETLAAGVAGYLTKDESGPAIVEAIRQVARGRTGVLSPSAASRLVAMHRWRQGGGSETLSERELQVLRLLGEGLGNKQIAARLGIAPSTVKNHLANIYPKLGVRSRVEAALWLRCREDSSERADGPTG
jgi:DNA-binding NarL/FixJ family response regulator